ncbi:glycosyltransferase [Spongiactinospora sp. TRM90649]|uniref:glycosyltransferase n=1 Tax=Spongiactinospora sp. TRM90649 TaxID=3031114 RepID=UPI0023F8FEE5|nr:glycosyltransferase [Spongiactinospora sp. TRM90649]MDF5759297.1 glycosyltransferase [Spongiactinospora sp. TRM90649]
MRICVVLPSVYGMRGDVRSVVNLAADLAERHDVEILSVKRHRDKPFFSIDPRVRLRWLIDVRPGVRHLLPNGRMRAEVALWRRLRSLRADVLITTRPAIGVQAAKHAPRQVIRLAREWGRPPSPEPIKRFYPRLDGVVAATESGREEWGRLLGDSPGGAPGEAGGPAVHLVPDALPAPPWPRSRMDNRIVAAGGRWVPVKGYDRLLRAFAVVADKRPDWRLRLYGSGPEEKRLRGIVGDLGLHNHVYFMGITPDLTGEFAKASIVAVSSQAEALGMTVIEALGCGVPVVGFDGPRGPGQFVESGRNGLLVAEGDGEVEAYAAALLSLIDDERRRRALAAGALDSAGGYAAPTVAARWEELISGLR